MSIVRVGLSENKRFAEGYDAIFGRKKTTGAGKKAGAARSSAAKKKKKKKS